MESLLWSFMVTFFFLMEPFYLKKKEGNLDNFTTTIP
jgi:hypothetical protein